MKKFLLKFLCFLLILGTLLGLMGQLYASRSPVHQELKVGIEQIPEKVDLVVIGSSHALFDIDFTPYDVSYFNLSMAGQTPRYDYSMLKEFEDHIADGATIVMTMSYMSPFWTEPDYQFQEKQTRYYRLLSPENIYDYDQKEDFRIWLNDTIPATRLLSTNVTPVLQTFLAWLRDLRTPSEAVEPEQSAGNTQLAPPTLWYDDLDHYRDIIERDHMSVIRPSFPEMNPNMKAAYENIFALAKAHNWRLIAVTPPFPRPYNEMFDQAFYDVFYSHVEKLSQEGGMEYWDYSHDPAFTDELELFGDMDHMLPEGCRRFSEILAQRLGLKTP